MKDIGRLGVWIFPDALSTGEIVELAKGVERLGYDTLWYPEGIGYETFSFGGFVLSATERLRAASGIANIYARDAVTAIAGHDSLNRLYDDRFILGLGVSHIPLVEGFRGHNYGKPVASMRAYLDGMEAAARLVLADALWWAQKTFKPHTMVDLATLTGAIIVSLGHHHAGLFANNDKLAEQLDKAGKATGEAVWRMPLGAAYDKQVRSQIADMKNVGGRDAGSITAAQILQRFVKDDVAWAHLDIAGVAWANSDSPTAPRGGTAFGVRLLDRLVADYYEKG